MHTIEYLKLEFKSAWGEINRPETDQILKFSSESNQLLESPCNSIDREFLHELLDGKSYDQFNYFVDDAFDDYLTNKSLCYYIGGWIDDILYYLPNDPTDNSNSSLIFFLRVSNLDEMLILFDYFTKYQIKVIIKLCNLYLDYMDYYFPSLIDKIDCSLLSETVRKARTKLGQGT